MLYPDKYGYLYTVPKGHQTKEFEKYLKVRGIEYCKEELYSVDLYECFVTANSYHHINDWLSESK